MIPLRLQNETSLFISTILNQSLAIFSATVKDNGRGKIGKMPKFYIGTSGWHYDHWKGAFYPPGLSKSKWLKFYSQYFPTLELNNSFYKLPSEKAFSGWRESSPPDFLFAVKANRFITHIKKLRNTSEALENFLSRARWLGEKLGPLLFQLPPGMERSEKLLDEFLSLLPKGSDYVFEFRNESWLEQSIFKILEKHGVGFCIYDMPGFTTPLIATVDFAYIRFHGSVLMYGGCYSDEELKVWSERICRLYQGLRAVYIYFNNDAEGFAVRNAQTLQGFLRDETRTQF